MKVITHKRGATLDLLFTMDAAYADGHFAGWTMDAQLRAPGGRGLVSVLALSWVDAATTRNLRVQRDAAGQDGWPLGLCTFDVRFVRTDGFTVLSKNVGVNVEASNTHDSP